MKKTKTRKTEVVEAEVKEVEELQELPKEETATETVEVVKEEPKKKPFWKSKKFLVGLGVLGGVGIAALSIFGIGKASENPYALEGIYDPDDPCDNCGMSDCSNCPVSNDSDDESSDDENSEE